MIHSKESVDPGIFERPIALVDIDGVMLDFATGLSRVLNPLGFRYRPELQTTYDFQGQGEEIRKACLEHVNEPLVYRLAPFYEKSLEAIAILKQYCCVVAYTASTKDTLDGRIRLCESLPFDYWIVSDTIVKSKDLVFRHPETGYIRHLKPAVLFDDSPEVLKLWADEPNLCLVKITQPYNRDFNHDHKEIPHMLHSESLYDAVYDYVKYLTLK